MCCLAFSYSVISQTWTALGAGGLSKTLGAIAVVQPSPDEHSPGQPLCLNVGSEGIHVIPAL